jgi:hypothetical protein
MLGSRPGPAQPLNTLLLALDLAPSTLPRSGFVLGRKRAVRDCLKGIDSDRFSPKRGSDDPYPVPPIHARHHMFHT